MARGMWTGIAAGLKDIEDRKRYDLERQDKLSLLDKEESRYQEEKKARAAEKAQERQDRLFGLAIELAPQYAPNRVLTPAGKSVGTSGTPSSNLLEAQLKGFNFSDEKIVSLQEQGPAAMQLAIDVYKDNYDPVNPPDQTTLAKIADSIIMDQVTSAEGIDPAEYAKTLGINLEAFPEDERAMRQAVLAGALNKAQKPPAVASTFMPTESIKPEDLQTYQKLLGDTLTAVLDQGEAEAPEELKGRYTEALRYLKEGSVTRAVSLLAETGELLSAMKPIFDSYPQLRSSTVPLGVFEPIRKALEFTPSIPQAAIEALKQNSDNPALLEAFRVKYGVDPEEYL